MTYEPRPRHPAQPARIVIVDDHELARAGLRSMLAQERDLTVVGEASDGAQALALCRHLSPDLILMDVRMPGLDGLAATAAIKQEYPATSVIIVTMYENPDYLVQALKAGAAGYLLKDATQREVVTAVRQVLRGEFPLHPHLSTHLLQRLAREMAREAQPLPERLTPREVVVLQLLAQGQTNREIARLLGVSVGTVKVHVQHIIAKLGVSDRTQAAVRAVELGLLAAPRR
jgi:DNA-binding NarL/FixJ family response regulator